MKILGMGNALVDILAKLPNDELLKELNVAKGSMNLIDSEMRRAVFAKLEGLDIKLTTGGSISNTILALKQMNVPVGFIGKVGDDKYGKFYIEELQKSGVNLHLIYEKAFSGTATAMITPDGERTFCTYLGAAAGMRDVDLQTDVFVQYSHLYVEGYLVQNHALIETAMQMAKASGLEVALDLASFNVVEGDRDFIQKLIDNYVDILFANEDEAKALTRKAPNEAIHEIADKVSTVIIKEGPRGSYVKSKGILIHEPVREDIKPLDTTAAGDYYAAGFFYGMVRGADMQQCARLGTLLAHYIIQVVGTKLPQGTWEEIREKAGEILG
ncbi:ribokinase [Candidatus Symbiothrix dinenymphae]|nr:ribokinase [Candidatus Symbiothrix dinenymphae]